MMPPEARINIGDQTFYAWRLIGMGLIPWTIYDLVRNPVKFQLWDGAIGLSVFWMVFAFMAYYGPGTGFVRGAALAIDVVIPYTIGRSSIRSLQDLRKVLLYATPALALVGLTIVVESMTFRALVRPAAELVFGPLPHWDGGEVVRVGGEIEYDRRLGLIRAAGPFSHPIMAGIFFISFLPLYLQSGNRGWPVTLGIMICFVGVLSLSSAALLLLIMGAGMVIADRTQHKITFINWPMIFGTAFVLLLAVHLISDKGIVNVIGRYTLNPQTAHFRELIWEYGTRSVAKNPWIGIGFDNYERLDWMVSSVDNNWLLLAIRFGVIPSFATLAAALMIIFGLVRNARHVIEIDRRLYVGVAITLFCTTLMGFTVAFFGGFPSWYYGLFGAAASLACRPARSDARVSALPAASAVRLPTAAAPKMAARRG